MKGRGVGKNRRDMMMRRMQLIYHCDNSTSGDSNISSAAQMQLSLPLLFCPPLPSPLLSLPGRACPGTRLGPPWRREGVGRLRPL